MPRKAKAVKRKAEDDVEGVAVKKGVLDETISQVSLEVHVSGLDSAADVLVFGQGEMGELGLGPDKTEAARPTLVSGVTGVSVAAGGIHSLVIESTRKAVLSFGCNDEGALGRRVSEPDSGDSDDPPESLPGSVQFISGDAKIAMITAGDCHSAALLSDGTVYLWGAFRDSHGILGLVEAEKMSSQPVKLKLKDIVKISSGCHHLVALSRTGGAYTLGCGEQGQLGRLSLRRSDRHSRSGVGSLLNPSSIPVPGKICDIWAGGFCTLLKNHRGKIFVCGLNNYYQLGLKQINSSDTCVFWPVKNEILNKTLWKKICPSEHHVVLLSEEGKVYTMGRKEYGRLGLGENCLDAEEPTLVPELQEKECIDIASSSMSSYALTKDGDLYSWGSGGAQMGLGDDDSDICVPTKVSGKTFSKYTVQAVTAGGQHVLLLALQK